MSNESKILSTEEFASIVDDLTNYANRMKHEIEYEDAERQRLIDSHKALRAQLSEAQKKLAVAFASNAELVKERNEAWEERAKFRSRCVDLELERNTLQRAHGELDKCVEALLEERSELRAERDGRRVECDAALATKAAAWADVWELRARLNESGAEIGRLAEAANKLAVERDRYRDDLEATQQEFKAYVVKAFHWHDTAQRYRALLETRPMQYVPGETALFTKTDWEKHKKWNAKVAEALGEKDGAEK